MVQQANKGRTECSFEEGDLVYLKLHPFRRNVLNNSSLHKLAARIFGPFKICRKVGKVAYELDLPPSTRIHPVFHVSLLKKHVGVAAQVSVELPPTNEEGQFMLEYAPHLEVIHPSMHPSCAIGLIQCLGHSYQFQYTPAIHYD